MVISTHHGKPIGEDGLRVRDRDSPVVKEGLVFRVYGYRHPPRSCVCDVEYAPEEIYRSNDPRSIRQSPSKRYHKFYSDGGLQYVVRNYPQYQLFDESLQTRLVGLTADQIVELRRPEEKLNSLLEKNPSSEDRLLTGLREVIDLVTDHSNLRQSDFGVFGSILHGFHHPDLSDLDFTVYGRRKTQVLRETLQEIYDNHEHQLVNEFDDGMRWSDGRHWYFENMPLKEFCDLSKRKMIYGIYRSTKAKRDFKVEFEPVRDWIEITEKYDPIQRIKKIGWIRAIAEVLDDTDSFFMPSIYLIEVKKLLSGSCSDPIDRIISFVEEFRGQAEAGEKVLVQGNLEVRDARGRRYQIVLSRTEDYYKQTLRPLSSSDTPRQVEKTEDKTNCTGAT